jgi:hypothetical protein
LTAGSLKAEAVAWVLKLEIEHAFGSHYRNAEAAHDWIICLSGKF